MEKYLIDDPRLTPTMDRVRSGRVQVFKENGENGSRKIELKHQRKEMYAELIDNKWYWINGCDRCNNKKEPYCYSRCESHDVCVSCGVKRSEIKEIPWGHSDGFLCKPCAEREKTKARNRAFEELDGEEPDTLYQDDIICPHCGTKNSSFDTDGNTEAECDICDGKFSIEIDYAISYTTSVIGKRITK